MARIRGKANSYFPANTQLVQKKTQISRKLHTFLGLQNLRTDKCHGVLAFSLRYSDKNVIEDAEINLSIGQCTFSSRQIPAVLCC